MTQLIQVVVFTDKLVIRAIQKRKQSVGGA